MYTLGGLDVRTEGQKAVLVNGGSLAGSVTNLPDCMRIAVKEMGLPLETAVAGVSLHPAKSLGIGNDYGSLETGKKADIVLLDDDLSLIGVIKDGILISGRI